MKSLKDRDYSYLKGTEVICFDLDDNTERECFIAGCDYKVGLSIVLVDDPDYELLCLNYNHPEREEKNYNGTFAHIVAKAKRGRIDLSTPDKVYRWSKTYSNFFGSVIPCAFK